MQTFHTIYHDRPGWFKCNSLVPPKTNYLSIIQLHSHCQLIKCYRFCYGILKVLLGNVGSSALCLESFKMFEFPSVCALLVEYCIQWGMKPRRERWHSEQKKREKRMLRTPRRLTYSQHSVLLWTNKKKNANLNCSLVQFYLFSECSGVNELVTLLMYSYHFSICNNRKKLII